MDARLSATHIKLEGFLDADTSVDFENSLRGLHGKGKKIILLDCAEVKYISDSGIGALLATAAFFLEQKSCLIFYNFNAEVTEVLRFLHIHEEIQIADDKAEAIFMAKKCAAALKIEPEKVQPKESPERKTELEIVHYAVPASSKPDQSKENEETQAFGPSETEDNSKHSSLEEKSSVKKETSQTRDNQASMDEEELFDPEEDIIFSVEEIKSPAIKQQPLEKKSEEVEIITHSNQSKNGVQNSFQNAIKEKKSSPELIVEKGDSLQRIDPVETETAQSESLNITDQWTPGEIVEFSDVIEDTESFDKELKKIGIQDVEASDRESEWESDSNDSNNSGGLKDENFQAPRKKPDEVRDLMQSIFTEENSSAFSPDFEIKEKTLHAVSHSQEIVAEAEPVRIAECKKCGQLSRLGQPGIYACPKCAAEFELDEQGKLIFFV